MFNRVEEGREKETTELNSSSDAWPQNHATAILTVIPLSFSEICVLHRVHFRSTILPIQ